MGGGIGGLLGRSFVDGGSWKQFNYYYDGQCNVVQVFEANAAQTQRALYSYDVWGNPTYALTPAGLPLTSQQQPYRFSTKWRHAASGLSYFGARWYDGTQGRWINRDPIGESGGVNLYRFVGNSPTNAVDSWGLDTIWLSGIPVDDGEDEQDEEFFAFVNATHGGAHDWPGGGIPGGQGTMGGGKAGKAGGLGQVVGGAIQACQAFVAGAFKTTAIGRMEDLKKYDNDPQVDTWWKSGRIPGPNDPPVTIAENKQWLLERIGRGDNFKIASDPDLLPHLYSKQEPGKPNGYFTRWEYEFLKKRGIIPDPDF